MRVGSVFLVELLFFLLGVHLADVLDEDGGTDDAYHAERISTGISIGDARGTVREYAEQCLIGSTQTWSVGYGTIERTHHHRQIDRVAGVEKQIITAKHHKDVEQYGTS